MVMKPGNVGAARETILTKILVGCLSRKHLAKPSVARTFGQPGRGFAKQCGNVRDGDDCLELTPK